MKTIITIGRQFGSGGKEDRHPRGQGAGHSLL